MQGRSKRGEFIEQLCSYLLRKIGKRSVFLTLFVFFRVVYVSQKNWQERTETLIINIPHQANVLHWHIITQSL